MVATANIADTYQALRSSSARTQGRAADGREIEQDIGELAEAFEALLSANHPVAGRAGVKPADASAEQMFEPNNLNPREQRLAAMQKEGANSAAHFAGVNRLDSTSIDARRSLAEASGQSHSQTAKIPVARSGASDASAAILAKETSVNGQEPSTQDQRSRVQPQSHESRVRQLNATGESPEHRNGKNSSTQKFWHSTLSGYGTSEAATANGQAATAVPSRVGAVPRSIADDLAQSLNVKRTGAVEPVRAPAGSPGTGQHRSTERNSDDSRTGGRAISASSRQQGGSPSRATGEPDSLERTAFDRLVRSIRLKHIAGQSTARLHLDPPELGRMRVDVRLVENELQVEIRAENAEAKDILSRRADMLRTALEQQDIHVGRILVSSEDAPTLDQRNDMESAFQDGGRQSERRVDDGGRARSSRTGNDIGREIAEVDEERSSIAVGDRRVDLMV